MALANWYHARLAVLPWTRFSAAAEAELEKRGAVPRASYGALGQVEAAPEALAEILTEEAAARRELSAADLPGAEVNSSMLANPEEPPPQSSQPI